jgi:hypothetical protein
MRTQATFTTLCKTGILADEALGNGLLVTVRRVTVDTVVVRMSLTDSYTSDL